MSIVINEHFDYSELVSLASRFEQEYGFLKTRVISRTSLSRSIFSFTVGNEKNAVLLAAGFHGSEWINCIVALRFLSELCDCIDSGRPMCSVDVGRAFGELGVTVVPLVNPDGTEIALYGPRAARSLSGFVSSLGCEDYSRWNANALGVDINHNFNAGWALARQTEAENGINGPAPRQYGGAFAASEAETAALVRLCRQMDFRQVMALHSQGEEIYWRYGGKTPKRSALMAKILADSTGYRLADSSGLAGHGGFKDWFILEFDRPGFTLETGKGENPLPVSQCGEIYARIRESLLLFSLM